MAAAFTTARDMAAGFAAAMNLLYPQRHARHQRTALFTWQMAQALGMSERDTRLAYFGALFHDVATVLPQDMRSLKTLGLSSGDLAQNGALLLSLFPMTSNFSGVVQASHGHAPLSNGVKQPRRIGQVINLSFRVTELIQEDVPALNQVPAIRQGVLSAPRGAYGRDVLSAFDDLCRRESVWLDMIYRPDAFLEYLPQDRALSLGETLRLAEMMARLIDLHSPFTAMHSAGVAVAAEQISLRMGMSQDECAMMKIAGYLHDIGKLRIPSSILEKKDKLTPQEYNIMKEHAYYTWLLLKDVAGFRQIAAWAGLHHERLDGGGYPFKLAGSQIPLGARIMAVADVFSAMAEDRPYKPGAGKERTCAMLRDGVTQNQISGDIVNLLISCYDEIDTQRRQAALAASQRYQDALSYAD